MPLSRKIAKLLLEGKVTVSMVVTVLEKYKLTDLLPSIKQSLIQMSQGVHSNETIMIETPHELSKQALDAILRMVGDTEATYKISINKNVLAGFKAKYKGMLYDGSAERIIRQITS
jgi:F0F1-type ATP synthase delta subunit